MTVQELIDELEKYPSNVSVGQYKCLWAHDTTPEFVSFKRIIYNPDTNDISIY